MATSFTATPAEPSSSGGAAPAFFSPSAEPAAANKNIVEASYASSSPSFEPFFDESDKDESAEEEEHETVEVSEDTDSNDVGFWHLLLTLYLPIAFVWTRRSMFGVANLARSLLLGHLMSMLLSLFSDSSSERSSKKLHWWDTLREAAWVQPFLDSKKADPHAWPPPALTTLAILTILAFIVHPDGLTWIMLGKLRDGILSFFTYLGKALGTIMDTYGILITLMASATLSALVFLGVIVYRTLSPRRRPETTPQPRKKKRKGNQKSRQRIRNHASPKSSAKQKRKNKSGPPRPLSPSPSPTVASNESPAPLTEDASVHSEKPQRGRIVSASTIDTFLVDDQSCDESTCARSISSAPATPSAKTVKPHQQNPIGRLSKPKRKQRRKRIYNSERRGGHNEPEPVSPGPLERNTRVNHNLEPTRTGDAVLPEYRGYTSSSFFSGGDENSQSFFSQAGVKHTPSWQQQQQQHTLRYNIPNYGAGDGRYSPGKLELAAFLARVGLVGTACAGLLQDLPNVDALESLSLDDFESKYQISAQKVREIQVFLEVRRQERTWKPNSATVSSLQPPIRPPPGLGGFVNSESVAANSNMVVGMERADITTTLDNSSSAPLLPIATSTESSVPPFQQASFGHAKSPPRASFEPQQLASAEDTFLDSYGGVSMEEEDSQIDQELQELGGQMVTSVLDF